MAEGKRVFLTLPAYLVRKDIAYTDRETGETRTFNSVRLPKGTKIAGTDVGGAEFSPRYVDPARFAGEGFYDIPLLADRKVRLKCPVRGEDGRVVTDEAGHWRKAAIEVEAADIKAALDRLRREGGPKEAKPAELAKEDLPF